MVTCKDCLHNHVCALWRAQEGQDAKSWSDSDDWDCDYFADKSRFVELPCKIGQKLYDISDFIDDTPHPQMYELKADYITFYNKFPDRLGIGMTIDDWEYNLSDFEKIISYQGRSGSGNRRKDERKWMNLNL